MIRSIMVILTLTLGAAALPGQDGTINSGIARRLAEVLDDVQFDEKKGVSLADLAAEVDLALIDVDPDQVAELNDELVNLERQERELLDRLGDLESGMPVIMGPVEFNEPIIGDVSEAALELARVELNAQQAEIQRLERLEEERGDQVAAERAARRVTPLSIAMLATLDEVPKAADSAASTLAEPPSEFPMRMARALFVSGDFIGALRQFKQVPAEKMTLQGKFELARCLEETQELDDAVKALDSLIAEAGEDDIFWRARAESLKKLIGGSRNIRELVRDR